jgi:hypothetical protein
MSHIVSRRLVLGAAVLGILLVLGSCELTGGGDDGLLGGSFALSEQLQHADKDGFEPSNYSGTIDFGMAGTAGPAFTATVTTGSFSVDFGVPAETLNWYDDILLGMSISGSLGVNNSLAEGYVVNDVVFHITDLDPDVDVAVLCTDYDLATFVYLAYSDTDVNVTASGTYSAPPNGTDGSTIDMDLELKAGWNRVVLTRTGSGPYSDTYRVAGEPSSVSWAYGF